MQGLVSNTIGRLSMHFCVESHASFVSIYHLPTHYTLSLSLASVHLPLDSLGLHCGFGRCTLSGGAVLIPALLGIVIMDAQVFNRLPYGKVGSHSHVCKTVWPYDQ